MQSKISDVFFKFKIISVINVPKLNLDKQGLYLMNIFIRNF